MKNLKKILLALVLVTLLVSSAVTVAIAEASYTGNVADAKALLAEAEKAKEDEEYSLVDVKAGKLKALYEYLVTVNPSDNGYAEIAERYDEMTLTVAHIYHEAAIAEDGTLDADAMITLCVYMKSAPVLDEENAAIYLGYKCDVCGEGVEFTESELFVGVNDGLPCINDCEESKIVGDKELLYTDLKKTVNDDALLTLGDMIDILYSGIGASDTYVGYYDVSYAKQAVLDFIADIEEMTYVEVSADVYTGDVKEAALLLADVDGESTFEELKAALEGAYKYMLATPISPLTDEYSDFITTYNELCDLLVQKLEDKIDGAALLTDKAAIFNDFYKFIAGDGENAAVYLSENVVTACNSLRTSLLDSFRGVDEKAQLLEKLEFVSSEIELEYRDDFDKFYEYIENLEAVGVDNAYAAYFIDELYKMANEGLYDPSVDPEKYAEAILSYSELCRAYVENKFVDKANAMVQVADKYTVLIQFREFVSEKPLCEAVINTYNELRMSLLEESKALLDKISGEELPEYVAPGKPVPTATYSVLNTLYSNLLNSYNAYTTAALEDKAAKLDEVKSSALSIYNYVLSSVIDTDASYFEEFVEKYNELKASLESELFLAVESATDKKASVVELGEYLKKNPITKATVVRYNELVDSLAVSEDEKKAMKLSNAYIDAENIFAGISASGATLEEKLYGAIAYDKYLDVRLDVTDPAYEEFLQNYAAMDVIVGDAIYLDIVEKIKELDTDGLKAYLDDCLDFIDEVYTQNLILSYRKAVKSTSDTLVAIKDKIESNNYDEVSYCETDHEKILGDIEAFCVAEDFETKKTLFANIYKSADPRRLNTVFVSGTSYAAVAQAYEDVVSEFEALVISLLDTDLSPVVLCENIENLYDFLKENSFSEEVVNTYNAAIDLLLSGSYHDSFLEIIEGEAVYAPKYENGWTDDVAAIKEKLEAALSATTASDEFHEAYEMLGGFEEENPKIVDFAKADFAELLELFNTVKWQAAEEEMKKVESADGLTNKVAALELFKEFAEKHTFSSKLAEYYNDKIVSFADEYSDGSYATFQGYVDAVARLHEILDSCPIDETLLNDAKARKYNIYKKLISIADFGELDGHVDTYDKVDMSDSKAFIVQNQLVDKINRYVKTNGISSYNDDMLVTTNTELLFVNLLDLFDAEIASLSDNERNEKISELGAYVVDNAYPENLLDLYNARYVKDSADYLKAATVEAATEDGKLSDFASIVTDISVADTYLEMREGLTALVEYANAHVFSKVDLKDSVQKKIDEMNAYIAVKTEEQKRIADSNAEISDYAKPIYKQFDHEDGKIYQSAVYGNEFKNTATMKVVNDATSGNRYAQMTYTYSAVPYVDWTGVVVDQGLVIDFDVMSHDLLSLRLRFSYAGANILSISNGQLNYNFDGSNYPDVEFSNYRKGIDDPIVFTPGEWTHITIIVNPDTMMMELLVDYVSIGTKPLIATGTSSTPYSTIRFQTNGATYNTICYDNLYLYAGASYRIFDKLENMSSDEKFAYCVDVFTNESIVATSRYNAYLEAEKIKDYVTEAGAADIEIYEQFDATEIKQAAHEIHMANLEALVKDVDVSAITTSNTSAMQLKVKTVSEYIEKNRIYFDQSAARFIEILDTIRQAEERATWLSNLIKYVSAVEKFNRAPTLAALLRYYDEINVQYQACELNKPDKYAAAAADPKVTALFAVMAEDSTIVEIMPEITIEALHSTYIPTRIQVQMHLENSEKIVDAVEIISGLVANRDELSDSEFIEELVARANENVEFVDQYLAVIREILADKSYDEDVAGVSEAIEIFEILDEVFFANLQAKHFGVISEKLNRYVETNSYIEKAGICTFVRNYISENNVDMSGVDGARYLHTLETYESELENYKKDYEAILEANTEAFIGIVNEMSANVSYSKLKPLYKVAIEKYYYNMNSDSAEVQAALLTFAELEEKIEMIEADAKIFLGYAESLRRDTRQAQIYQALVNCSKYVDKLDTGVAGVAAALELYEEKLLEYNESIEPINSEISTVTDVVSSFRTNSISATVLAVLKNIFYINK